MNKTIKTVKENIKNHSNDLNWLLCNLLGATEIAEIAYSKNELKTFMEGLAIIALYRDAIKKHEIYLRETGIKYE